MVLEDITATYMTIIHCVRVVRVWALWATSCLARSRSTRPYAKLDSHRQRVLVIRREATILAFAGGVPFSESCIEPQHECIDRSHIFGHISPKYQRLLALDSLIMPARRPIPSLPRWRRSVILVEERFGRVVPPHVDLLVISTAAHAHTRIGLCQNVLYTI